MSKPLNWKALAEFIIDDLQRQHNQTSDEYLGRLLQHIAEKTQLPNNTIDGATSTKKSTIVRRTEELLPSDILFILFEQYLIDEIPILDQVCRHWHTVCNEVRTKIANARLQLNFLNPIIDIVPKKLDKYNSLQKLSLQMAPMLPDYLKIHKDFKAPYSYDTITEVFIDYDLNVMSVPITLQLLKRLPNLEKFSSTGEGLVHPLLEELQNNAKLKSLHICLDNLCYDWKKTIGFIANMAPRLETLILRRSTEQIEKMGFSRLQNVVYFRDLEQECERLARACVNLKVMVCYQAGDIGGVVIRKLASRVLEEIHLWSCMVDHPLMPASDIVSALRNHKNTLKHVGIIGELEESFWPYSDVLGELPKLEHFVTTLFESQNSLVNKIEKVLGHCPQIKYLTVDVETGTLEVEIVEEIFHKNPNLKRITLTDGDATTHFNLTDMGVHVEHVPLYFTEYIMKMMKLTDN